MDTIFTKPKNFKTSDPHGLVLNIKNQIILVSENLSIYYTWESIKYHIRTINLKN